MNTRKIATLLSAILVGLLTVLLVLLLPNWAQAAPNAVPVFPDQRDSISAGVNWLVNTHQNSDGGYTNFSTGADAAPSGASGTLDAILAIASTGLNPAAPYAGKTNSPVDFLQTNAVSLTAFANSSGGSAGKTVMGLVAANQNPHDFAGVDYVAILSASFAITGSADANGFNQSLAMLGMAAAKQPMPANSVTYLKSLQATSGGWDDGFGTLNNPDATAMSIQALLAAGEPATDPNIVSATTMLASAQLASGGFEYGAGFGQSINSTALVLQALKALGQDFYSTGGSWDKGTGATPLAVLLDNQAASGAFQADFGSGPFDDFFTSVQTIPAVAGKSYPLAGRGMAASQAVSCLEGLQDSATGGWEEFGGFGVNASGTSRAIQALTKAGVNLNDLHWKTITQTTPIQALENLAPTYMDGGRGGRVGIVMQGVAIAGGDVTTFGGGNLYITNTNFMSPTGALANTAFGTFAHSEAMLGIIEAGLAVPTPTIAFLQGQVITNGTWGGPDSTGLAMQVFGRISQTLPTNTITSVKSSQLADGGWTGFGTSASINSTAEIAQGLWANDIYPFSPEWSQVVSGTVTNAADTVMATQLSDGCFPGFSGTADPFSTTDALIMLMLGHNGDVVAKQLETYGVYLPVLNR